MRGLRRLGFLLTLTAMIFLGLSGCVKPESPEGKTFATGTYSVDPLFTQFYTSLGGEDLFGMAISRRFSYNAIECQYLQNALMCYDPAQPDMARFTFYPLGLTFQLQDEPDDLAASKDAFVVDGYQVYSEFVPLYEQLLGQRYVGKPLTRTRVNYEQRRIEQYFENMGFYRRFDDPPGAVRLLSYGSYACADRCPFAPAEGSAILQPNAAVMEQPFTNLLATTRNLDTVGQPITGPQPAADGGVEQVYVCAALYSPDGTAGNARLRPLPSLLGMTRMDPAPQVYNEQNGVTFYPVNGALGYHVPLVFHQYILDHGGYAFSGRPIAEVMQFQPHLYRQCFEYVCLDFDPSQPEGQKVSLAPLGREYLVLISSPTRTPPPQTSGDSAQPSAVHTSEPIVQPTRQPAQPSGRVELRVSESRPHLSASDQQTINLLAFYTQDGSPAVGAGAVLRVILPDGSEYRADFPPADEQGQAALAVPGMPGLENGTVLTYEVCLTVPGQENTCVRDGYLIWNPR